jgi:hypothetical protein
MFTLVSEAHPDVVDVHLGVIDAHMYCRGPKKAHCEPLNINMGSYAFYIQHFQTSRKLIFYHSINVLTGKQFNFEITTPTFAA